MIVGIADVVVDSPVSNNGRGLKLELVTHVWRSHGDSPVSNNGRGLKPLAGGDLLDVLAIRPLAITGVD